MERALIDEYRASMDEVLRSLGPANVALAVEIARVPETIRGYGHVKARHLETARPKWDALMADWRAGPLRVGTAPHADTQPSADAGEGDTLDTVPFAQAIDSRLPR